MRWNSSASNKREEAAAAEAEEEGADAGAALDVPAAAGARVEFDMSEMDGSDYVTDTCAHKQSETMKSESPLVVAGGRNVSFHSDKGE